VTQQTTRVEEAKQRMESKRNELVEGMKEQKVLEKLHTRYQAEQTRELSRREARTVDDMVITRYARDS
jgi:flagellar export protein FliJ